LSFLTFGRTFKESWRQIGHEFSAVFDHALSVERP